MKSKKSILSVVALLLLLTTLRFVWLESNHASHTPEAINGVLHYEDSPLLATSMMPLNGEWHFYKEEFLLPGEQSKTEPSRIQVPGKWHHAFSDQKTPYGYGTYRLLVQVDADAVDAYRLYVKDIVAASRIFINGEEKARLGHPAISVSSEVPDYRPQSIWVDGNVQEIEILIHVSNFYTARKGGIVQSIKLGNWSATEHFIFKEYAWQFIVIAILMLHSLYALLIYTLFSRKKEMLFLALALVAIALSISVDDDKLLLYFFSSVSFEWWRKIVFIAYTSSVYFSLLFVRALVKSDGKSMGKWSERYFQIVTILYGLFVMTVLLPVKMNIYAVYSLLMFMPLLLIFLVYRLVTPKKGDFLYLLLAIISLTSSLIWGSYKNRFALDLPYYPFDMLIGVMLFSLFSFKRFFMEKEKSENLAVSLQKEIEQKDDFLANTSHELRNPLHGILNISQTIYDSGKTTLPEETKRDLETLMSVGRRMSMIINDMLDREQLKEAGVRLDRQAIRIAPVIINVFDTLKFMKEGKSISFVNDIAHDFPCVKADENRLFQILFNLVHNAVKFSENGTIRISADIHGSMAKIHVTDEGIGMDKQMADKMFLPYIQSARGIDSTGGGGLGLGLSICRQLVELHGGTINAITEEGKGSVLTFSLPLAEEHEQPFASQSRTYTESPVAASSAIQSVRGGAERILVVDDDPMNLAIIRQMLTAEGYETVTCTSGKEAIQQLDAGRWDLVISDVMMPYMSGYELALTIRKRFSIAELPILLLTARTQLPDIQMGFEAGANDYVRKPVEKLELMMRVRALTTLKNTIAERVQMEAAWLQAQIQPHFLFNTLNTISALSEIDPQKMVNLLEEFGNYLQQSFTTQNLEPAVPIEKELELVTSYIFIEQQRYGERLKVELDMASLPNVQVPPLSIQTLVENAIVHGVLKRPEGGTVRLEINDNGDYADIIISDDGPGMTEKQLDAIMNNTGTKSRGVGLPNTNKRLRQLGNQSLMITSILNKGTVVRFSVPK